MRRLKSLTRLVPASGGFNAGNVAKIVRFARMGCANRPFYHIVVAAINYHNLSDGLQSSLDSVSRWCARNKRALNIDKCLSLTFHRILNLRFYDYNIDGRILIRTTEVKDLGLKKKREQNDQCIEQIGSFDPMANERNEKMLAINFERLAYWIGQGVATSKPISHVLGLSGFFPIHPRTYMTAWRNRRKVVQEAEAAKAAAEKSTEGAAQASTTGS